MAATADRIIKAIDVNCDTDLSKEELVDFFHALTKALGPETPGRPAGEEADDLITQFGGDGKIEAAKFKTFLVGFCENETEKAELIVKGLEAMAPAGAAAESVGMNPLKLGAAMANIDLETTQGPIKFADWLCGDADRPWTIFFSHPADFTPVCTTELGQCHMMAPDFAAMGAKLIGVSCDSVESHNEWAKDVVARATPDSAADPLAFPIIGDADRSLVTRLGMLDPAEICDGMPAPARVLVILYGNVVKLTILYPATTGRNFVEVKRVLTSLKLTVDNGFATPVDWKAGDNVVVTPGYAGKYPDTPIDGVEGYVAEQLPSTAEGGMRAGKPYLKTVPFAYVEGLTANTPAVTRSDNVVDGVNPLNIGNSLPPLDLETTTGPVNLATFHTEKKPWTILFSHPADFTPVCTTELGQCHIRSADFAAMGAQLIGVSCDSVESHNEWAKDVVARATPDSAADPLAFPIIADPDRNLVTQFGMLDADDKDAQGAPMPARVLVILHKNVVKLTILYPATTGRDFDEVKRVLNSLQMTMVDGFATPANWNVSAADDNVFVTPGYASKHPDAPIADVAGYTEEQLPSTAEGGLRAGKPYIKTVPYAYVASLNVG